MTKRIIGYIRVSTDQQTESGLGLDSQKEQIEAYCTCYGYELIDIVVDAGKSARSLKGRDGLNSIINRDRSTFDGIAVSKLDRLTRSLRDLQFLLDGAFEELELHSVAEKFDTSSATGRMMLNMITTISQWEAETIGERTKAALAVKKPAARAKHSNINGRPPFGYQWIDGALVEEPSEYRVLSIMKELRSRGSSYPQIAAELKARGCKTKRGGDWFPSTVSKTLKRSEKVVIP